MLGTYYLGKPVTFDKKIITKWLFMKTDFQKFGKLEKHSSKIWKMENWKLFKWMDQLNFLERDDLISDGTVFFIILALVRVSVTKTSFWLRHDMTIASTPSSFAVEGWLFIVKCIFSKCKRFVLNSELTLLVSVTSWAWNGCRGRRRSCQTMRNPEFELPVWLQQLHKNLNET